MPIYSTIQLFDFSNTSLYQNIILNGIGQILKTLLSLNEYIIGQDSEANGQADLAMRPYLVPLRYFNY